jgi:hypothetical protein
MRRRSSSVSLSPWAHKGDHTDTAADDASERRPHGRRKLRQLKVTVHVAGALCDDALRASADPFADILVRHKFILKLAKALMAFGAPSHRIEAQLNAIADVLDVDGHFIHLPAIVIASFGDPDVRIRNILLCICR